ncbi:branched-chain amino acid transport system II carrier protein [Staphylococcus sp. ACRSN]|uniref:YkvI family membrane protein n=1 Tax=Staphylococcus sp. ACRSN TaxID=2918214 RepID=UPI001EF1D2DD|nr:branched-chain amino acid transport system II carrier protein [Staphylococcus sp. ACRSN]MCG7339804.1 branched-chain amino acid transport system II carrier protein [Staphylococcus sp. ACRSN]
MGLNKESIKIGFAYVGIVVGAGFSTGQEVMQFFTSYGLWSYIGVILSGLILGFIGRQVAKIGSAFDAQNHESTLDYLFSDIFSKIIDYLLIFFLFGISVTMIAGAGSTFKESFDIPTWLGALIMVIAIYITLLMDFNKIVRALGVVTPFLIIFVVIIAVYYLFNGSIPINKVNNTVPDASFWKAIIFGINYGGLAFAVGFSTIVAIGGDASKRKVAGSGALFGGVIYTILLALINFALQAEYPKIKNVSIPTLTLANDIHPWIGFALSIIMLAVMYNTILGLMYSFAARFTEPYSKKYHIFIILMVLIAFGLSFVGFTSLINFLYPIMGIIGLIVVVAVLIKYYLRKNQNKKHIA